MKRPRWRLCDLNAAQYGFLLSLLLFATRVPAIEREKREWAINFKCYVRCVHERKILFWPAFLQRNGFLIIFLVICFWTRGRRRLFSEFVRILMLVNLLVGGKEEAGFSCIAGRRSKN